MSVNSCSICLKKNLNHTVVEKSRSSTEMFFPPFKDDLGEHHHDYNSVSVEYECSQGHTFWLSGKPPPCPNQQCEWSK